MVDHLCPYTYSLAGLGVRSNRPLALESDGLDTDGQVSIWFTSQAELTEWTTSQAGDWYLLPGTEDHPLYLHWEGQAMSSSEDGFAGEDYLLQTRAGLPFASALQGKVVIHGVAVAKDDKLTAFIGASGVGKTTLAKSFRRRGWTVVGDDLLPVRGGQDRFYIPAAGGLELGRVCFLHRSGTTEIETPQPITPQQSCRNFMTHGFGELPSADLWEVQFQWYGTLAQSLPAYSLALPTGLDELELALDRLEDHWNKF